MSAHWVWMVIALYGSAAWVATTWIRARYNDSTAGLATGGRARRRGRARQHDDGRSSQDRELERLEARVRVLERIVTDRKAELEREFEQLRSGK